MTAVGDRPKSAYLESLLTGLDSGDVASNATADNDEVLLLSLGGIRASPSRCNGRQGGLCKGRSYCRTLQGPGEHRVWLQLRRRDMRRTERTQKEGQGKGTRGGGSPEWQKQEDGRREGETMRRGKRLVLLGEKGEKSTADGKRSPSRKVSIVSAPLVVPALTVLEWIELFLGGLPGGNWLRGEPEPGVPSLSPFFPVPGLSGRTQ